MTGHGGSELWIAGTPDRWPDDAAIVVPATGDSDRDSRILRRVYVDIRTVNSRFLEVKFRHPFDAADESGLKKIVESKLGRGRVDVRIRVSEPEAIGDDADKETRRVELLAELSSLQRLAAEQGVSLESPTTLDVLDYLRRGNSSSTAERVSSSEQWPRIIVLAAQQAVAAALDALVSMRIREGELIFGQILEEAAALEHLCEDIRAGLEREPQRHAQRIEAKVRQLLGEMQNEGGVTDVSPERIVQEVALLVARGDIQEELTRIRAHIAQVRGMNDEIPTVGQGKRLEFLCQELGREFTTLGSKITDHAGSAHVIDAKARLERIREQAQNVE